MPHMLEGEGLSDQQILFANEYIKDFHSTNAAIRAGYTERSAHVAASRLLRNDKIKALIDELKKERMDRVKVDADYVLRRHRDIDQMDVLDIMTNAGGIKPVSEWPVVWRQYLSAMDVAEIVGADDALTVIKKIKWPDKLRNLELLGKHIDVKAYDSEAKATEPIVININGKHADL